MKITIKSIPEVNNRNKYTNKRQHERVLDFFNLLAVGNMVKDCLPENYELILDFKENKFEYVQGSVGFYTLDGSGESLLHLIGHQWLIDHVAPADKVAA